MLLLLPSRIRRLLGLLGLPFLAADAAVAGLVGSLAARVAVVFFGGGGGVTRIFLVR